MNTLISEALGTRTLGGGSSCPLASTHAHNLEMSICANLSFPTKALILLDNPLALH